MARDGRGLPGRRPAGLACAGPLGGLPFNIEGLLRRLQEKFGDRLNPVELIALPLELHHLVDPPRTTGTRRRCRGTAPTRFANVGIYGWDVRDCLSYTACVAAARLAASPPHDDLLGAIPSNDSDLAARSVLAAFGPSAAHFALEYGCFVDAVRSIDAHRVLLATVPHVTVAPIANGVNLDAPDRKWRDGSRYADAVRQARSEGRY